MLSRRPEGMCSGLLKGNMKFIWMLKWLGDSIAYCLLIKYIYSVTSTKTAGLISSWLNVVSTNKDLDGTSLVVQWLRVWFAMPGIQVQSLVAELKSCILGYNKAKALQLLNRRTLEPTNPTRESMQLNEGSRVMQWGYHMLQLRPKAAK